MVDESTQTRILDAGKAEFLEKGYKNASLRSIAQKAGLPREPSMDIILTRLLCLVRLFQGPLTTCVIGMHRFSTNLMHFLRDIRKSRCTATQAALWKNSSAMYASILTHSN